MNTLLKILSLLIAFFLLNCGNASTSKNSTTDSLKTENSIETQEGTTTKWIYQEEDDKMNSKKKYFATIDANELLNFEFPYNGGSTASLQIRNQNNDNDIMLIISKGQFIGGIDGGTIRMKFDDENPIKVSFSTSSDGSSDVIFINSEKKIISKLKKSSITLVEAEFYNEGIRQMEFNTKGFEWKH